MAESQSKRVEEEEKVGRERLQNQREKNSLEIGVCVLAFPCVQLALAESWRGTDEGAVQNQ